MTRSYWLLKTEPQSYPFHQLVQEKKTNWNGVRNFQARNFLKQMERGDLALIYHSGNEKAVMGTSQVIREAYPDLDPKKPGDWVQIDLKPIESFSTPVQLAVIKSNPHLNGLLLIKQSRLSVMPVDPTCFQILVDLGKVKP